jgi:hypothetical protein
VPRPSLLLQRQADECLCWQQALGLINFVALSLVTRRADLFFTRQRWRPSLPCQELVPRPGGLVQGRGAVLCGPWHMPGTTHPAWLTLRGGWCR